MSNTTSSPPPPTAEQWTAITKLVQQFYNKPDAEPFRDRVDYESLGLLDYPTIIKTPMDLGCILRKLASKEKNEYGTIYDVADDVRLVWSNCMTYNADESDFFKLAQSLGKKWEERYTKLLSDHGLTALAPPNKPVPSSSSTSAGGTSKDGTVSLEDKRTLAKNLYKLSREQVGMVLVELDDRCPSAVVKNAAEDEYEINVDNITGTVFRQLTTYVDNALSSSSSSNATSSSSNKKKKTTSSSSSSSSTKKQKTTTTTTTTTA